MLSEAKSASGGGKNKNFEQDQLVKFTKKSLVFDLENKTEFFVPKGSSAKVVLDEDAGDAGSTKLKLKRKTGDYILVETDDKNLELVE